jgi:hypothetical protein
MEKKDLKRFLNDLITDSDRKKPEKDMSRIVALDIPIVSVDGVFFTIDLNNIFIFKGMETIVLELLEEIREACFFGQSDVSVNISVEKGICPELYNLGIHKIFFYSLIENLEQLPLLYKNIVNHLNYIFNAIQSPAIHAGFLTGSTSNGKATALLFPFNREVEKDSTGLHYLVERVPGSHFLRITVEELEHSRLNFRRINHRIVSNIELIDNYFDIHQETFLIHSSILNRCHDYKLSYNSSGLQLSTLIGYLKSAGYDSLREITINWPRQVIRDMLTGGDEKWFGNIPRLMLILADSTTHKLLNDGSIIITKYKSSVAFVSLTQMKRNLQIDLQEKLKVTPLDEYLQKMEGLYHAVEYRLPPLNDLHVLFIHHFTAETLSVLGAFDKLGVASADTLWVKYSGGVPVRFLETILSLPVSIYRFYGLEQVTGEDFRTRFRLSDNYSLLDGFSGLQRHLEDYGFEFYPVMQQVAMHLFLKAMTDGRNTKILIAEDGGYLAPLVNRLAMEKKTVGEVVGMYGFANFVLPDDTETMDFGTWIAPRFCGSVEHTRNGYDALMEVEKEFSELAFPACSLAISRYKVNDESVEVAYSCVNAIENILIGHGFVLNNRTCLVLGSLGAIGLRTMNILAHRTGSERIAGIDIKYQGNPDWPWNQFALPEDLPEEILRSVDLIFGVVGKSVLDVPFFENLILNTRQKSLFLASGSTKRFEFIDFLNWTESLLCSEKPSLKGVPVTISSGPIEDPQTSALLGTLITFRLEPERGGKTVEIYVLSNGMPVNFQYYGVPRETMDQVMTELVSLVGVVAQSREKSLPAKVLALDHSIDLQGNLL